MKYVVAALLIVNYAIAMDDQNKNDKIVSSPRSASDSMISPRSMKKSPSLKKFQEQEEKLRDQSPEKYSPRLGRAEDLMAQIQTLEKKMAVSEDKKIFEEQIAELKKKVAIVQETDGDMTLIIEKFAQIQSNRMQRVPSRKAIQQRKSASDLFKEPQDESTPGK